LDVPIPWSEAEKLSAGLERRLRSGWLFESEQGAIEAAEKLRKFHAEQQARKIVG
jgi:hypothetical protein